MSQEKYDSPSKLELYCCPTYETRGDSRLYVFKKVDGKRFYFLPTRDEAMKARHRLTVNDAHESWCDDPYIATKTVPFNPLQKVGIFYLGDSWPGLKYGDLLEWVLPEPPDFKASRHCEAKQQDP